MNLEVFSNLSDSVLPWLWGTHIPIPLGNNTRHFQTEVTIGQLLRKDILFWGEIRIVHGCYE